MRWSWLARYRARALALVWSRRDREIDKTETDAWLAGLRRDSPAGPGDPWRSRAAFNALIQGNVDRLGQRLVSGRLEPARAASCRIQEAGGPARGPVAHRLLPRADPGDRGAGGRRAAAASGARGRRSRCARPRPAACAARGAATHSGAAVLRPMPPHADRKSTRLNSSH